MNMIEILPSTLDLQSNLFKALAHPVRLAILNALRDGEQCVCHLEAHLGLRQAYLSQQLSVLRAEGLVELRRDGWNRYYRVVNPDIFRLIDAAQALLPPGAEDVQLTPNPNCPCPGCSARRSEENH